MAYKAVLIALPSSPAAEFMQFYGFEVDSVFTSLIQVDRKLLSAFKTHFVKTKTKCGERTFRGGISGGEHQLIKLVKIMATFIYVIFRVDT